MVAGKRAEAEQPKTTPPPANDGAPKPSTAKIAEGAGVNFGDEQEKALFFQNKGKLERLLATLKDAQAAVRNHGKVVKSDHGEHGFAAMKMAIKLQTSDEAEDAERKRVDFEAKVMRWMGMPVGSQGSLFEEVDRRPATEKAYDLGKLHGMEGKSRDKGPYDLAHPEGQEYARGWHDGQEAIFNIKGPEAPLVKGAGGKNGKAPEADAAAAQ